jgi:predicted ATPase
VSPRQHYATLLALVELLEETRAEFQRARRDGDDPTHAHQSLCDALSILHGIVSDLDPQRGT